MAQSIKEVKPGLSGIGSIIFRDEEKIMAGEFASREFYDSVIAPYKGSIEEWYVGNQSIRIYFLAIFLTVQTIVMPSSGLVWRIFKTLPVPPESLADSINYKASG